MNKNWIALIPAYEPSENILPLLQDLQKSGFQVLLVDDGSSPEKKILFREAMEYATVLAHTRNRGKGAALKTGLHYIRKQYIEECIVVTLDADGQHTVEDAVRAAQEAEAYPQELVLGKRILDKDTPIRSRFGNGITRLIFRISTGSSVYDTQTGLRAFSSDLIPAFYKIEGERYEYEMNVLLYCAKQKIPMREITIETIYLNDNESSHFDTIKDSGRIYKEILKFSGSSFLSFLVDYGLFNLFALFGVGVTLANVIARLISATFNYSMNRKFVFDSEKPVHSSLPRYAALAGCILIGNTFVLRFLVGLGIPAFIAKILTETAFFVISWLVQRSFIFRGRKNDSGKNEIRSAEDGTVKKVSAIT